MFSLLFKPDYLIVRTNEAIASPLFFYNTVYLNDKDEQLFITAMKKIWFQ